MFFPLSGHAVRRRHRRERRCRTCDTLDPRRGRGWRLRDLHPDRQSRDLARQHHRPLPARRRTCVAESTRTIEPGNRETLWPSQQNPVLAGQGFSTVVESDHRSSPSGPCTSTTSAAAMTRSASRAAARPGTSLKGSPAATRRSRSRRSCSIGNDNARPRPSRRRTSATAGAPVTRTYTVLPQSRFNIWTDSEKRQHAARRCSRRRAFSVRLDSSIPIVAERAVYWGTPSAADPTTPDVPVEGRTRRCRHRATANRVGVRGRAAGRGRVWRSLRQLLPGGQPARGRHPGAGHFATEDGTGVTTTVDGTGQHRAPTSGRPQGLAGVRPASGTTLRRVPRERGRASPSSPSGPCTGTTSSAGTPMPARHGPACSARPRSRLPTCRSRR